MKMNQEYKLKVKNLMNLIPVSSVAKQIDNFEDEGEVLDASIRWVVGDYAIYSDMRDVYTIGPRLEEYFEFFLTKKDYKAFVLACNKRRAEMKKQIQEQKH